MAGRVAVGRRIVFSVKWPGERDAGYLQWQAVYNLVDAREARPVHAAALVQLVELQLRPISGLPAAEEVRGRGLSFTKPDFIGSSRIGEIHHLDCQTRKLREFDRKLTRTQTAIHLPNTAMWPFQQGGRKCLISRNTMSGSST